MISTIILPGNALASTTAYIGGIITDLGPFLWLAIGVPLAFYVINYIRDIFDYAMKSSPEEYENFSDYRNNIKRID